MRSTLIFLCSVSMALSGCSFRGNGIDGRPLSLSGDSPIKIAPFDTISLHDGPVTCLDFAPNSNRLLAEISGGEDRSTLKIWQATAGEMLECMPNESFRDRDAVFSHDGTMLAIGNMTVFLLWSDDFRLRRMFDPQVYEDIRVVDVDRSLLYPFAIRNIEKRRKYHYVTSLSFSGDDRFLVSGHEDSRVTIWEVRTGSILNTMWGSKIHGGIRDVEFSPDGRHIAACQNSDRLMVWSFPACEGCSIEGCGGSVNDLAFDPAGGYLASAGGDGRIRIWDVETGGLFSTLEGHGKGVLSVGFSKDGRLLASAGKDRTVRLWSPRSGRQIAVLLGCDNHVNDVAFNSNASIIAGAGDDGTILLWDISGLGIADPVKWVPAPLYPPKLECSIAFVDDTDDGALAPGERGRIILDVSNTGRDAAYNIVTIISPDRPCEGIKIGKTEMIPMILPGRGFRIETEVERIDEGGDCGGGFSVKLFEFNGFHVIYPRAFEIGYHK